MPGNAIGDNAVFAKVLAELRVRTGMSTTSQLIENLTVKPRLQAVNQVKHLIIQATMQKVENREKLIEINFFTKKIIAIVIIN